MASVLDYLPAPLTVIREFTAIASAEDPELTDLWTALRDAYDDQFVDDLTDKGIVRWESQLHISPKPTSTQDERKAVIKAKTVEQTPYSFRVVERRLATLCGADGYSFDVNVAGYMVTVKVALTSKEVFDNVSLMLEEIIPLNMTLSVDLMYNQHQTLAAYTHARLGLYTHQQVRDTTITDLTYAQIEGMNVSSLEGVN